MPTISEILGKTRKWLLYQRGYMLKDIPKQIQGWLRDDFVATHGYAHRNGSAITLGRPREI